MVIRHILAVFGATVACAELPLAIHVEKPITSRLHNVHVALRLDLDIPLTYTYGSCDARSRDDHHHVIADKVEQYHNRLIWKLPLSVPSGSCISAWTAPSDLVGRSAPVNMRTSQRQLKRSVVPMDNTSGIDTEGPWFDGVTYQEQPVCPAWLTKIGVTQLNRTYAVDANEAKSKSVAIIGAGMAGLMTWLCLNQSAMTNLQILEGSDRFGGRVQTGYFGNPAERLYQDMGAMRIPRYIHRPDLNITLPIQDHRIVYDVADESKQRLWIAMPGHKAPEWQMSTLRDIAADASYAAPNPPLSDEAKQLGDKIGELAFDPATVRLVATNLFQAHKEYIDRGPSNLGGDQWSEFVYIHNYLKYSLNATDQIVTQTPKGGSLWTAIYQNANFLATEWQTVDGGLSRLANAFYPQVDHLTRLNTNVNGLDYDEQSKTVKISYQSPSLQYTRSTKKDQSEISVDYAISTVPFAVMRRWNLPNFSITKNNAINSYGYEAVCKVALKFRTRFWEHLDQPIYGSCSTTSRVKGIGSICYPSNDINFTGPGVMLASYTDSDAGIRWASIPEAEHVQYVVDAMADTHSDIVYNQYTGEYRRKCWVLDRFATVSWGAATVGQRQLYIPEFFRTEKGVILAGEGTSYSSAWVSSALDSGVRASVQLLLELGLIDEAKAVVNKWMARWISI